MGHTKFEEGWLFKAQDYTILTNTLNDQKEEKDAKIALQMLVLKSRKKPKSLHKLRNISQENIISVRVKYTNLGQS